MTTQKLNRHSKPQFKKPKVGFHKQTYSKSNVYATSKSQTLKFRCCEGQCASLAQCSKFRGLSVNKRIEFVKANKLCLNCLVYGHYAQSCYREKHCKIAGCPKSHKHHFMLHMNKPKHEQTKNTPSAMPTGDCNLATTAGKGKVCLRILPVRVESESNSIDTYALLDNGSDVSLCDQRLVSM